MNWLPLVIDASVDQTLLTTATVGKQSTVIPEPETCLNSKYELYTVGNTIPSNDVQILNRNDLNKSVTVAGVPQLFNIFTTLRTSLDALPYEPIGKVILGLVHMKENKRAFAENRHRL